MWNVEMSQNVSVTNRFRSHYLPCFFLFPMQGILPQKRGESLGEALKKRRKKKNSNKRKTLCVDSSYDRVMLELDLF